MRTGPMATRTSLSTLLPTASTIRRTCRLRPSVMVISRNVCLPLSRRRFTSAGRVGPSLSSIPPPKRSICSSLSSVAAFSR